MLATYKNWKFLEQGKAPILIFKVQPILDKLEKKIQNRCGPPVSRPFRTTAPPVMTTFVPRPLPFCCTHGFATDTTRHAACAATVHRLARL
jgi:hypothetical protein